MATDDLSITVGQQQLSGWTSVRVTRGIEKMPNDFQIEMTEYFPADGTMIVVHPGAACQVKLGNDLVLTGYVDEYGATIDGEDHSVNISGRSMSEDIVDSSAEYPNAQVVNSNVLQIAQKFAHPYGITVAQSPGTGNNQPIPQFNLMYGETAVEIIERICRYSQLIFYDMPDGSILLTQASTNKAASGFQQGVNVQSATVRLSMTRYSDYTCVRQSVASLSDGQAENSGQNNSMEVFFNATDKSVTRHRQKVIILESGDFLGDGGGLVTRQRAQWELNRRYGKDYELRLVTDSWRDSAGKLWEPNTLVNINIPALKLNNVNWLINEVTYSRDETNGTTATLILNPPQAFMPEPIILIPQPFAEGISVPSSQGPNPLPLPAGSGQ